MRQKTRVGEVVVAEAEVGVYVAPAVELVDDELGSVMRCMVPDYSRAEFRRHSTE